MPTSIVSWLPRNIVEVEDADATVGDGDYALLALSLTDENGEEVVNEPGTMFHMGNNKFYTGLEEHVAGMKAGESKESDVTITEDSNFEHLRNKTFKVALNSSKSNVCQHQVKKSWL